MCDNCGITKPTHESSDSPRDAICETDLTWEIEGHNTGWRSMTSGGTTSVKRRVRVGEVNRGGDVLAM